MLRTIAFVLLVNFPGVSPGLAQDYPFQGLAADISVNTLHNTLLNTTLQSSMESETGQANHDADRPHTRYDEDPNTSRKAQRQFLAFIRKTSGPAAAAAVKAEFAKQSPVKSWASLVSKDDLKPGDAVDAVAAYWILNWIIANGTHEKDYPTGPVLGQVRAALAASPQFGRLSQAQRQEFSEVLMMNFLVQQAVYSQAVRDGNSDLLRRLSAAAVARFTNEAGVNLRSINLTVNGFAAK